MLSKVLNYVLLVYRVRCFSEMYKVERVIILAFDALEASLVEKWRLKYLLQEYHGVYEAPKSPKYGKPHTPNAWTSFITGLPPEVHGVDDWWSFGRVLDWLRKHPPLSWIKGKRVLLRKLGINIKPKVVGNTALFVPAWNEPTEPREEYAIALEKGLEELIKTVWKWHKIRKEELFKHLDGEWKLLMAWFDIADMFGHVCWYRCRNELFKAYLDLNSIAKKVREKVGDDTAVLIVSDHGMKGTRDGITGDHSPYGFWSLNVEPPLMPKKITDFKPMIHKLLGISTG